ncbi:MAG: hypothetical protein PWP20_1324 [Eubacteriaceae bacterium]|jgi:hypothetical protein|nr:hypothetical protein [Eubacteriaceae bacterium]
MTNFSGFFMPDRRVYDRKNQKISQIDKKTLNTAIIL